jgi:hypothetical protein
MSITASVFDTADASGDHEVDPVVDTIVATLREVLPIESLRGMTDDRLVRATGSIERLGRVVDALRVEAAGEIAQRSRPTLGAGSLAVTKGCRDATELLRRITLASTVTVRRRIRVGVETRAQEALSGEVFPARFPHLAAGLASGALGVDAAAVILTELAPTLTRIDAAAVGAAEAELVAAATGTSPDNDLPCTVEELRTQAAIWRVFLDQDGTEPVEDRAMNRRAFGPGSYNSGDGLVHGRYAILPEIHAKLGRVFDACLTPKTTPTFLPHPDDEDPAPSRTDDRTPDQQRHDVFAAMIDGFARSTEVPTIGGASPTVLVTITTDDLTDGGPGFIDLGGPTSHPVPLSGRAVRQMICTGGTQHVTLTPDGNIIQLGSEQRCFTPAQRRAITTRDGGCIIPGCTIPAAWCEIHHVTPHAHGGPTHPANGVLLCWYHHRTIDTSGWEIRMTNGVPHLKAPPWLATDNHWHPSTKSPTRKQERLRRQRRETDTRHPHGKPTTGHNGGPPGPEPSQ